MSDKEVKADLVAHMAQIVAAYVSQNPVADLPRLMHQVYDTLQQIDAHSAARAPQAQEPAVPIAASVTPDYIICLEDGKKMKMLKRYLKTAHGMTPEQYRKKWGLSDDYPMVAPNYAEKRSSLAKESGLGTNRGDK